MRNLGQRTRFVTLLAIGVVLLAGGLLLGQTRYLLILGASNSADLADTMLSTTSGGAALHLVQNGTGVGVRGTANSATGVAGEFSSLLGTGVAGIAGSGDGFAVHAANQAPTTGNGGAISAAGQANDGLVAESWSQSAVVATAGGSEPAVVARGRNATAVRAEAPGGADVPDCQEVYCAGLEATGANGVIAGTGTAAGAGVYAADRTPDASGFGVVSDGSVVIDGSASVTGGCLGCGALILGRNATDLVIRPGDPVALVGIDIAPDGSTIFAIRPAVGADPVLGLADGELILTLNPGGDTRVAGGWRSGAADVPGQATMRIAIAGVLTLDRALEGIPPGTRMVVGQERGPLVPSSDPDGPAVATYLGVRPDGRGVLLIDPD